MRPYVEILAPAGSTESMRAAVNAGADAVYMGGSRFGARAYADNPDETDFLKAIDYAHLHGCRLYMTVNTLVKQKELGQLYEYLLPYYEGGLDAVIVQDMGVFALIRQCFPCLPIHASTQMTVTGYRSAKLLKELGAARVVTARELSLPEIAEIRDQVDIEIESFVHGALCYCYSGQCLLSSLIGGRSGNRGRCAQPCRLPYDLAGASGRQQGGRNRPEERYLLSLKDLCTLELLPDILEAGVCSLKIEGRMKSPRYTAGVVSIYRKYVDSFLSHGREGYRVDPADKRMLLELFDRGGFTQGYYRRHNGRDMVALREKPAFREGNQALFEQLDRQYVEPLKQEPVSGHVTVREGEPAMLSLTTRPHRQERPVQVTVTGAVAVTAQNQPLSEEKLKKQMKRTGNAPFYFENLTAELSGSCFLPVQALNELRRTGIEQLEQRLLSAFHRRAEEGQENPPAVSNKKKPEQEIRQAMPRIHVSLEEIQLLETAVNQPEVDEVYLDSVGFGAEVWRDSVEQCHRKGKRCALVLPHVFRREAEAYFTAHGKALRDAGFDELVLRSLEETVFLKEAGIIQIPLVFDSSLYVMNHLAAEQMIMAGADRLTFPLEQNSRELEELAAAVRARGPRSLELVAYGCLPAMVSAQCIVQTTRGCTRKPELLKMKDRTGKELPVKNHCRFCYNTIYNPSPLSLLGESRIVDRLRPDVLRLSFTSERPEQAEAVIRAFVQEFRRNEKPRLELLEFTRGHWRRGVE